MENLFMPYKAVEQVGNGTAVVFAPHPDDEVFGCAGAIMRHIANGDAVHVVIVTNGGHLDDDSADYESYADERKQECLEAAKVLGYGVPVFWGMPDRGIVYGEGLIGQISKAINEVDAEIIYAPSIFEMHPDHRALGMSVVEAVRRCDKEVRIAMYEVGVPMRPNLLLDITDLAERKQEAMQCFKSQLKYQNYDQQIIALNKYRTYTLPKTVRAAEAYLVKSREELQSHLPELYASEFEKQKEIGLTQVSGKSNLVTVIVRSIGRVEFLKQALGSVALQTYPNIEVLVVNAKGESHPEIGAWCGRFPLRMCGAGEPLPRSQAANMGLSTATGDYLIFLDDDDLFDPEHIANLLYALNTSEGAMAAYAGVRCFGENENMSELPVYNAPFDPIRLFTQNYIPINAVLFDRKFIDSGARFDETLDLYEDWDFWLQLSQKSRFVHVDSVSAQYRLCEESETGIHTDHEIMKNATLRIYKKWKSQWSDQQLTVLLFAAHKALLSSDWTKDLNTALAEKAQAEAKYNEAISDLDQAQAEKAQAEARYNEAISERDAVVDELNRILNSKSWRIMRPIRVARRALITAPLRTFRRFVSGNARFIWCRIPVSVRKKNAFKEAMFRALPILFNHTAAYRSWEAGKAGQAALWQPKVFDGYELPTPLLDEEPLLDSPVRLIAFYLPQFHPIPENDAWWGKDFTEWTNVKSASPQFAGHYQPYSPGELGYYDLRDLAVQRRQVELAKLYGVEGFCFYFYWFGGKRLLETPILQYLENNDLNLPFCLCWANENWSRSWDGLESEVLVKQEHSVEDDLEFIKYISKYLKDPRYIRVHGKPLLIVYRPDLHPSPRKTAKRWRNWCRKNGIGEIFLAYTQSFEMTDPRKYDFDYAIEFPPNNRPSPILNDQLMSLSPGFSGTVYDMSHFVEQSRNYKEPDYPLFRGICPAWDNTPRRKNNSTIFFNQGPGGYWEWLKNSAIDTVSRFSDPSERLVFVNAWNEWAEGAYLEPDQQYGYAYLQATRDALEWVNNTSNDRRIVLVAHDAQPHGAQMLILHMAKVLNKEFGFAIDMVVLGDGPFLVGYARYARVHVLDRYLETPEEAEALAAYLFNDGVHTAIANTTVTGLFLAVLKKHGFHVVSLIHEMSSVIEQLHLQRHVKSIVKHADYIVFPARRVRGEFEHYGQVPSQRAVVRPQGLFRKNSLSTPDQIENARKELRDKFNLPETAQIILCIGFGDSRKGVDLFVETGLKVLQKNTNAYFIWVGNFDPDIEPKIHEMLSNSGLGEHFVFSALDFKSDIYYAGSDIYALMSREDPFPSVVLEALDAGLPVAAFEGVGGSTELLSRCGCPLVPAFDTTAYAHALNDLMCRPDELNRIGQDGKAIIESEFSFKRYLFDLLELAEKPFKRVSVVVPNYNYSEYLADRIYSIAQQDYPIYEIIILDDASDDDSIQILNKLIPALDIDCRLVINEGNSGSTFAQWLKGVKLAKGDYVWIAEADDLAEPGFLTETLKPFDDPDVIMSYCQSKQMDASGGISCNDYLDYVSDISQGKWLDYYIEDGNEEVRCCLSVKNTIPNVSAVIFNRKTLLQALKGHIDEIQEYRVAGDWLTYIHVLCHGKLAFSPKSLNLHRRHEDSVTNRNFNVSQLEEVLDVQQKVRKMFQLDKEASMKAQAYSQLLYEHFGLVSKDAPTLTDDSKLAAYLDDSK